MPIERAHNRAGGVHRRWVRRAAFLAASILGLNLGAGCKSFDYSQRTVLVRDAETGVPLHGATVSVNYHPKLFEYMSPPRAAHGATDRSGRVTLEVATNTTWTWQPEAAGYLPWHWQTPTRLAVASEMGVTDVLELWRAPMPVVEFVLPARFRGPFTAKLPDTSQGAVAPRRAFTYHVDADREVVLDPHPVLRRFWDEPIWSARNEGGVAITVVQPWHPYPPNLGGVLMGEIRRSRDEIEFFIGTEEELRQMRLGDARVVPGASR